MQGFLSDFVRDLLNVLGVLLEVVGILLAILFALPTLKDVWDFARNHLTQGFSTIGRALDVSLKASKRAGGRARIVFQTFIDTVSHVLAGKVKLVARCTLVLAGATALSVATLTWLHYVWTQGVKVRREAEAVARCERLEYRLARVQGEFPSGARTLELSCKGRRVYQADGLFYLNLRAFDQAGVETSVTLEPGQQEVRGTIPAHDITGDAAPDILLETHGGGSCCGPEHELVSLSIEAKSLVRIEQTKYEEDAQFEDLDGDGIYEIRRDDVLFEADVDSASIYAISPVVLALKSGEYRIEPRLMRQPPPSESELRQIAEAVLNANRNEESPSIYRYLMVLAYRGNGYEAQRLVDLAIPEDERVFLWREFKGRLSTSDYWSDVAAMNGWDRELSEYSGEGCGH